MIGLIYAPDTLLVFIDHNNGGEENTHMTSHNMIVFCGVVQGWQLLDSMSSQSHYCLVVVAPETEVVAQISPKWVLSTT